MTREGRSSNSASALAASREPVSHNTDAAIVALADYAARVPRTALARGRIVLAQAEVQIPSDAQLERMEERAITTPPLDVQGAPGRGLSEGAKIRQMDERARRIDKQLMGDGAIRMTGPRASAPTSSSPSERAASFSTSG